MGSTRVPVAAHQGVIELNGMPVGYMVVFRTRSKAPFLSRRRWRQQCKSSQGLCQSGTMHGSSEPDVIDCYDVINTS